jgi:pimeloyl-ACP methyl ester carboxylesterase
MAYFKFDNKRIFYKIKGEGEPLLLLHGNTVSSRMFSLLINKYTKEFKVITIDFPGHGKSDRLERFETDFWFYNSKVARALIDELGFDKVSVVGTSGGALVAINLGLEHPENIKFIVADSFEGEFPLSSYIESIESDREKDKKKLLAKLIWWYCHGSDWKNIVDLDTQVNIEFSKTGKSFFHHEISELKVPSLLTGSMNDEYCGHLDKIYAELKKKNDKIEIHLFEKGNHPAMISNKDEFLKIIKNKIFQ